MAAQLPEVEDYYDKVHRTTWARRTAGLFAGIVLGIFDGAVMGTVAAFLPYVIGNMMGLSVPVPFPDPGTILKSIGLFSGVLAGVGMVIGADVGANSSSISVGLEEKERREKSKEKTVEQSFSSNVEPSTEAKKPFGFSDIYSWKTAIVLAPMFAAFGALIASNPITASVVTSLSFTGGAFAANSTAAIISSGILFGVGGALMGVKNGMVTNKISNFFMRVFSEDVFDKLTGGYFTRKPAKDIAVPQTAPAPSQSQQLQDNELPARENTFASEKLRFSLQGMIEKTAQPDMPQEITR